MSKHFDGDFANTQEAKHDLELLCVLIAENIINKILREEQAFSHIRKLVEGTFEITHEKELFGNLPARTLPSSANNKDLQTVQWLHTKTRLKRCTLDPIVLKIKVLY